MMIKLGEGNISARSIVPVPVANFFVKRTLERGLLAVANLLFRI